MIYPGIMAPIFLDRDCLLKTHFCIGLHYAWRDDPQLLIQVGGAYGLPRTHPTLGPTPAVTPLHALNFLYGKACF